MQVLALIFAYSSYRCSLQRIKLVTLKVVVLVYKALMVQHRAAQATLELPWWHVHSIQALANCSRILTSQLKI